MNIKDTIFLRNENCLNFHANETGDNFMQRVSNAISNAKGRVAVPILLYFLGVPGFFVILIWVLFFRG